MTDPFSPKTISFLRAIKRNNKKSWFEAHRGDYETYLKGPSQALIASLDAPLRKHFPGIEVSKRSVTRIYRDTRFSKDKSPYKNWVGFSFRDKTIANKMGPSVYFGFDPTGFVIGAGIYNFEGMQREHFRQEITSEVRGAAFRKIMAAAKRAGYETEGRSLKKIPIGFDSDHPNADFLLYNGCYLTEELDLLKIFYSPKFSEWLVKSVLPFRPFYMWMREMAKTAPKDPRTFFHIEQPRERENLADMDF